MALTLLLVVLGVACLICGAALIHPAAGFLVAGACAIAAAYVVQYFKARAN